MKYEYQHGIFCSGSPYLPRTPGNTCSCHSCDLFYTGKLKIERNGTDAKRTCWIAACPTCHKRTEFPFENGWPQSVSVPKEVFCFKCEEWVPVEPISWEGTDFAKLLPVGEVK